MRVGARGSPPLALWVFVLSSALGGAQPAGAQCQYEATAIQPPPCAFTLTTWAFGVSDAGHVVGWHLACSFDFEDVAYVWTAQSGMVDIPFPDGAIQAHGFDVNSAGRAVGSVCLPPEDFAPVAFLYEFESGQVTMLGTLPGATISEAVAVNELGQIAGTSWNDITGDPPLTPFIWEDGVMTALDLPLGPNAVATDINDNGQIVGWMGQSSTINSHAYIWQAGVVTDLGLPPGAFASAATAINNAGQVLVSGMFQKDEQSPVLARSFIWETGQWTDLGLLPGFDRCAGTDLNNAGQVVGVCGPSWSIPFLWQDGLMTRLDELIPEQVGISAPSGINNLGQIALLGSFEGDPAGILLAPADQPPGDIDHDCTVGINDFLMLLVAWGSCPPLGGCPADLDGSGGVGMVDFLILLASWSL